MFQNIGFTELLLIAIVALVLFGPQKLPEIGRMLGKTVRDFKKGAHALLNDEPQAPAASNQADSPSPQAAASDEGAQVPPAAAPAAASAKPSQTRRLPD
ncbi:twin-arginine translocase TatA/TatE family subunit [Paenibacillus alba]|uniref:Sec-independent protein translocase protein TatA n=1 Tax=Paenibacillus alba TaxID=1197127 RepID=A0ABU6G168_9BACL|nr:twin-arginine translocase TatA/TatE family subunit [Paenibacillus alba]MEC0227906.1 twin-arginine translocase TatA/TatE family subunit [Paenibacillus alba]